MDKDDVKLEKKVEKETHDEIKCLRMVLDFLHHLIASKYSDSEISTFQGSSLDSFRKDKKHLLNELKKALNQISNAKKHNKKMKRLSENISRNLHAFRNNPDGCRLTKHEKRIISTAKSLNLHMDDIRSRIEHSVDKMKGGLFDEARNESSEAANKIRTVVDSLEHLYFIERKLEGAFKKVDLRKKAA